MRYLFNLVLFRRNSCIEDEQDLETGRGAYQRKNTAAVVVFFFLPQNIYRLLTRYTDTISLPRRLLLLLRGIFLFSASPSWSSPRTRRQIHFAVRGGEAFGLIEVRVRSVTDQSGRGCPNVHVALAEVGNRPAPCGDHHRSVTSHQRIIHPLKSTTRASANDQNILGCQCPTYSNHSMGDHTMVMGHQLFDWKLDSASIIDK